MLLRVILFADHHERSVCFRESFLTQQVRDHSHMSRNFIPFFRQRVAFHLTYSIITNLLSFHITQQPFLNKKSLFFLPCRPAYSSDPQERRRTYCPADEYAQDDSGLNHSKQHVWQQGILPEESPCLIRFVDNCSESGSQLNMIQFNSALIAKLSLLSG